MADQQKLILREMDAGRMEACIDPEDPNETLMPLNVYVFRRDEPDTLLVCEHCKEVIYDFPLIEVGPATQKNFHADRDECSAASIRFQIEHDSVWWVIPGPDEAEEAE